MDTDERYRILIDAYSNPTKLKVIFILAENDELTVTQMASRIDVSRANLYHFVKQMVGDGLLNSPSVRPKENYVEKYYSLNSEFFGVIEWENMAERLKSLTTEQIRSVFRSMLISHAFNLHLLAEKLEVADSGTIDKLKGAFIDREALSVYASTRVGAYPELGKHLKTAVDELSNPEEGDGTGPRVRVLILSLPYI